MISTSGLNILLIDPDPIFRLGFRLALEAFPDVHLGAEFADELEALNFIESQIKGEDSQRQIESNDSLKFVDIVVWELEKQEQKPNSLWYKRLKIIAPNLPILLLTQCEDDQVLNQFKNLGIQGYCRKGTDISTMIQAIRQVVRGESYWLINSINLPVKNQQFKDLNRRDSSRISQFFLSGLKEINYSLTQVELALSNHYLSSSKNFASFWEKSVISGQRRELLVARWIVKKLGNIGENEGETETNFFSPSSQIQELNLSQQNSQNSPEYFITKDIQSALFDVTFSKLQSGLENLTAIPLEIDILRQSKKQELFYVILRQIESILDELRWSRVHGEELLEKQTRILRDLWQNSLENFLGKYYSLSLNNKKAKNSVFVPDNSLSNAPGSGENSGYISPGKNLEVIPILLQDIEIIDQELLQKIPLVTELFSYILFGTPLIIDNVLYVVGSPEAMQRGEALLQNLVITLANSIIQPLLNHFANFEEIKQTFYDRRLISTREIEKFRNNLSWKYRFELYLGEAQAIFESRYFLLILTDLGIERQGIYSPRNLELENLSGVQLMVTLVLETRDAIAPRLRLVVAKIGSILIYLLTQVIGRGIGLIGRGILEGIGNAWNDVKNPK